MSWIITGEVGEFLAEAGDFLRAEPVRNSVLLTVTENLRVQAAAQSPPAAPDTRIPGPDQPLFGWWRPSAHPDPLALNPRDARNPRAAQDPRAALDPQAARNPRAAQDPQAARDPVGAVCLHTPEFPVNLSFMSPPAAAELARDLAAAGRRLTGVHAGQEAAEAFAAAWRDRTGDIVAGHRLMRLFRLDELIRPEPGPEGAARLAARRDRDLLTEWFDAFVRDVGDPPGPDPGAAVDQRLGYGGLTLWEVGGTPVSMAGLTRSVAGMVRVGSVYTPPALRGRGYAGAVTAAVSRAARDAGVREVVLFTDLANPTSNALYQRLGYRPVEDRVTLSFERARQALGFTGERTRGLRPAGRR
jgi:RimJ/RimL family protein N-acetyltransferase